MTEDVTKRQGKTPPDREPDIRISAKAAGARIKEGDLDGAARLSRELHPREGKNANAPEPQKREEGAG